VISSALSLAGDTEAFAAGAGDGKLFFFEKRSKNLLIVATRFVIGT
jgi:hypothetical protein